MTTRSPSVCPSTRITNMAHDDLQVGELERDYIDIRSWSADFTGASGCGVAHLCQERDVEFDALHERGQ